VLGWPPLFIAFIASILLHDPAEDETANIGGGLTGSTSVWIAAGAGLVMVLIWILGCLILLIEAVARSGPRP
jgi:hypothetical protein